MKRFAWYDPEQCCLLSRQLFASHIEAANELDARCLGSVIIVEVDIPFPDAVIDLDEMLQEEDEDG